MATRKGIALHNLLFIAVFSPTLSLLTQSYLGWIVTQPLGFLVVNLYKNKFPMLIQFKKIYVESQLIGLMLGAVVYIFPAYRLALCFLWAFIYLFYFFKPLIKVLGMLSDERQ